MTADPNKLKAWSDQRDSKATAEDLTHALGDTAAKELPVSDLVTKRGIVVLTDCQRCGRQWKGVIAWGEIVQFYIGEAVPNTRATRAGVLVACRCNSCQNDTPMMIDWDEVRRYVDVGVRCNAISPSIHGAAQ